MDDQPPDADEGVEVSDLRKQSAAAFPSVFVTRRPLLTPRQRLRRLAVMTGSVLLALLVLVAAVPGLREGTDSWLATFVPTPTATLPPGSNRFYFITSVPDIQLSIDGRSVGPLPRIGTDPPLVLARGQHRISWQVDPFLQQSCVLAVPIGLNDTCSISVPVSVPMRRAFVTASILWLGESMATLSANQQSAVLAAIQHGLANSTSEVESGDHYAVTQVATQALRGTLDIQLDIANAFGTGDACTLSSQPPDAPPYIACTLTSSHCTVCTIPTPVLASAGVAVVPSAWYVVTFVSLSYTISTLSGQTLIANGPISQGGLAVAEFPVLIALTWDGAAWQTQPFVGQTYDAVLQRLNARAALSTQPIVGSPSFADPGCAALPDFIGPNVAINTYRSVSFVPGTNPADGCLAIVTVNTASSTQKAYYLYRFGGLVAVNDVAERQHSMWPVASAHEQQIAAAILSSSTPAP